MGGIVVALIVGFATYRPFLQLTAQINESCGTCQMEPGGGWCMQTCTMSYPCDTITNPAGTDCVYTYEEQCSCPVSSSMPCANNGEYDTCVSAGLTWDMSRCACNNPNSSSVTPSSAASSSLRSSSSGFSSSNSCTQSQCDQCAEGGNVCMIVGGQCQCVGDRFDCGSVARSDGTRVPFCDDCYERGGQCVQGPGYCGCTLSFCGDGTNDIGETCLTCPQDTPCEEGTQCCADGSCRLSCGVGSTGSAGSSADGACMRDDDCDPVDLPEFCEEWNGSCVWTSWATRCTAGACEIYKSHGGACPAGRSCGGGGSSGGSTGSAGSSGRSSSQASSPSSQRSSPSSQASSSSRLSSEGSSADGACMRDDDCDPVDLPEFCEEWNGSCVWTSWATRCTAGACEIYKSHGGACPAGRSCGGGGSSGGSTGGGSSTGNSSTGNSVGSSIGNSSTGNSGGSSTGSSGGGSTGGGSSTANFSTGNSGGSSTGRSDGSSSLTIVLVSQGSSAGDSNGSTGGGSSTGNSSTGNSVGSSIGNSSTGNSGGSSTGSSGGGSTGGGSSTANFSTGNSGGSSTGRSDGSSSLTIVLVSQGSSAGDSNGSTGGGSSTGNSGGGYSSAFSSGDSSEDGWRFTCQDQACVPTSGEGEDSCEPQYGCGAAVHTVCEEDACISVSGAGSNECNPLEGCGVATHRSCENNACVSLPGPGPHDCDSFEDCASESWVLSASLCGNGLLEPPEQCEDGNLFDGDGCSAVCSFEYGTCGDGRVQLYLDEQCEPALHDPSLPYGCEQCRFLSEGCGNGRMDLGEQCDNAAGNADTPNAFCRTDCSQPRCGDGVIDDAFGETCDDGNHVKGYGCDAGCSLQPDAQPGNLLAAREIVALAHTLGLTETEVLARVNALSPRGSIAGMSTALVQDLLSEPQIRSSVLGVRSESQEFLPLSLTLSPTLSPMLSRLMAAGGTTPADVAGAGHLSASLPVAVVDVLRSASLPVAVVDALRSRGPVGETGPAAVVVIATGAAGGVAWMRKKRRRL